jgi:hypothetical protein
VAGRRKKPSKSRRRLWFFFRSICHFPAKMPCTTNWASYPSSGRTQRHRFRLNPSPYGGGSKLWTFRCSRLSRQIPANLGRVELRPRYESYYPWYGEHFGIGFDPRYGVQLHQGEAKIEWLHWSCVCRFNSMIINWNCCVAV